MFLYTALFVASVVMALGVLWLYRLLFETGRQIYRSILPGKKSAVNDHVEDADLPTTINGTLTPWGWDRKPAPARVENSSTPLPKNPVSANYPIPWGWKGNKHKVAEYQLKEGIFLKPVTATARVLNGDNSGPIESSDLHPLWPNREDDFEFAGSSYKVTRKVKPKKSNLKNVSKPWGW